MAFIGQLMVELGVNMGAFRDGLREATNEAKKFGGEVQNTFEELGQNIGVLAGAFGALGPAGAAMVEGLSLAGQAAGKMMKEFAGANRELGVFAAGAAGVVAAGASLAVSAIALTTETAKQIKEMGEMAMMTGLTIQQYSALSGAAVLAGISTETFLRGTERLSRTMMSAAQGNKQAEIAFQNLGVQVQDSSGHLRDTESVLMDLADRFKDMADGPEKTALAMQLMSRGGAAMIPFLNEGSEGIREFKKTVQELGGEINGGMLANARSLVISMNEIKLAGTGVAYQLENALAPAVDSVAQTLIEGFKGGQGPLHDMVDSVAWVTKSFIFLGEVVFDSLSAIGQYIGATGAAIVTAGTHIFQGLKDAAHGNMAGMKDEVKALGSEVVQDFADAQAKVTASFAKAYGVWNTSDKGAGWKEHAGGKEMPPPENLTSKAANQPDTIAKMLADLEAQAAEQEKIAALVGQTAGAYIVLEAAAKANIAIAKQDEGLQEKIKSLEEQKANAHGATAKGNIQSKIDELQKYRDELVTDTPKIISLEEMIAASKYLTTGEKKAAEQTDKNKEQIASLRELANAYREGGAAIRDAQVDVALVSERKALAEANQVLEAYRSATNGTGKDLDTMTRQVNQMRGALEEHRKQLQAIEQIKLDEEINKQTDALRLQVEQYNILAGAIGGSIAQQRAAAGGAAYQATISKGGTIDQASAAQANALLKFDMQRTEAANNMLKPMAEILNNYQDQREALRVIVADNQQNVVIQNMAKEKLIELNAQWDAQMLKVGTLKQQFGAWVDQIANAGHNLGQMFFGDMSKALDGFNQQLTQLIVTGKANFKELGKSIESSFVSSGLKFTEGKLMGGLEKSLGIGPDAKPGSSAGNPIYAQIVGGLGDLGGGSGAGGGLGGMLPFSGGGFNPMSLLGLIPGLAGGGDVTPGKAYVVGEDHPEFFIPGQAGKIAPVLKTDSGAKNTTVHAHFHGVTDMDSFRQSEAQVMNRMANSVSKAANRR